MQDPTPPQPPPPPEIPETESDAVFATRVDQLVREHRARLARVARAEGLSPEDALDCVQEALCTFLTLPRARALAEAPEEAARLLVVVARNAARNRRRRHFLAAPHAADDETLGALATDEEAGEERLARAEELARLEACVAQLGEAQRRVVRLRVLEEQGGEDVAALMGLTTGHVAVLLHRARASLRACMVCEPEPTTDEGEPQP